jgi:CubicO group peptidase (beta-lactamase class C family)
MGQVGLTYGVLYQGQVVLARGHGFRDAKKRKVADERTLFNIASCTKAFTATACVLLANEGLLDLNAPVKRYLPELKEEEATLIDLLAHRTGYARLDMNWVGQRSEVLVSQTELNTRVKALPRIRSLRSEWFYNNWMYALVGVIIGRHSKEGNYLESMKKRLFV